MLARVKGRGIKRLVNTTLNAARAATRPPAVCRSGPIPAASRPFKSRAWMVSQLHVLSAEPGQMPGDRADSGIDSPPRRGIQAPSGPHAEHGRCRALSRLICDRDTKWSGPVLECLREGGIRVVQTPYRGRTRMRTLSGLCDRLRRSASNRIIPWGSAIFDELYVNLSSTTTSNRIIKGLGIR
jgi:hypothetical protein